MVLILISLMISDDEQLFIYFLAICISPLEKCPFGSFMFYQVVSCFAIELKELLIYFGY